MEGEGKLKVPFGKRSILKEGFPTRDFLHRD